MLELFSETWIVIVAVSSYVLIGVGCTFGIYLNKKENPEPGVRWLGHLMVGQLWPLFLLIKIGIFTVQRH
jgi:hypothetical protein